MVFLVGTIYNLNADVLDNQWTSFWKIYMWVNVVVAIFVTIWFTRNGFKDLKEMLKQLKSKKIDINDNGVISENDI